MPAVAEHFRVPEEQIREAVRLIAVSGIPGETSQYQHGDLFDIAWDDFEDNDQIVLTHLVAIDDTPRFSGREAAALIAGLQYLSALPESADRTAMATLADKLSRGCVRASERRRRGGLRAGRDPRAAPPGAHPRACRSNSTTSAPSGTHGGAGSIRCASNRSMPTGTCAAGATCARACARSGWTGSAR